MTTKTAEIVTPKESSVVCVDIGWLRTLEHHLDSAPVAFGGSPTSFIQRSPKEVLRLVRFALEEIKRSAKQQ